MTLQKSKTILTTIIYDEKYEFGYNDFIYSHLSSDIKRKERIEKCIEEFEKDLMFVIDELEEKIKKGEISDSNDFSECFEELTMKKTFKEELGNSLNVKDKKIAKKI